MKVTDIIAIAVTIIGVISFVIVISILYKHYIDTSIAELKRGDRDIELIDSMVYENKPSVKKKRKAINITKNIVYYTFLAFIIPIFGLSIYSKIKDNVTSIGGNSVLVVASGSMSEKNESNDYLYTYNLNDQFQTYDMIIVSKVADVSKLSTFDIIAFKNNKGINIIHRIKEIIVVNDEVRFITRGDANNTDDAYRPKFDDVIGVYSGRRIKGIGMSVMFFQSYAGIITVVSVVYTMIYISFFNRKLEDATFDRKVLLDDTFDIDNLNDDSYLEFEFINQGKIYYRDNVYIFDSKQLIDKHPMDENEKEEFDKLQKITFESYEKDKQKENKHGKK